MTIMRELAKLAGYLPTANNQDVAANRLLKVGDFGIGSEVILLASAVSWDTLTVQGDYHVPSATGTNVPFSGGNFFLRVVKTGTLTKQFATPAGDMTTYSRAFIGGAWTGWFRVISNFGIVGTVSQAGGLMTNSSAIIETGTTANGTYTKFADGSMICRCVSGGPVTTGTAATGAYYSPGVGFTFPQAFVGVPAIVVQTLTSSNFFCWAASEGNATSTGCIARAVSLTSTASTYVCCIAYGRWTA